MAAETTYNHCPACGRRIDARRAIINSEVVAFRCKGCDARLVKKTGRAALGVVAVIAVLSVRSYYGWGWPTWLAFALIVGGLSVYALNRTSVRLATADDPDPAPKDKIPDGPPPLDPTFRGASAPPGAKAPREETSN